MVKPVRVRFVIEPSSLKELDKLFDKFKLTWDDKVFKKVDDLGISLDALKKVMHDVWRQNAYGQYQKAKAPAGGMIPDLQKLIDQMSKEFDKMTTSLSTSIDKTTKSIDKLELGAGKATDGMMSFEERMDLLKESTNKELMAIEARQQGDVKRYKMREALSDKEEAGRKQRLASRGWMNMLGGSGSIGGQLTKVVEPFVKDLFKPMQEIFKFEEFGKTKEGMEAEQLRYATAGGAPLNQMGGLGMYQKAGIQDPDKARAGGGGIFGRAKRWLGGRVEAGEKGGIAGMVGGAKGMAAIGGAMVGVKVLQKAISLGIESSPMMQQMLKLWKFGIMMIFRPIGDFFGFFLRPIFVMLLRKFIIPFYQEYLPLMQQMGHDLGTTVVKLLEKLANWLLPSADVSRVNVEGYTPDSETAALTSAIYESIAMNSDWWEKSGLIDMQDPSKIPDWIRQYLPSYPLADIPDPAKTDREHTTTQQEQINTMKEETAATKKLEEAIVEANKKIYPWGTITGGGGGGMWDFGTPTPTQMSNQQIENALADKVIIETTINVEGVTGQDLIDSIEVAATNAAEAAIDKLTKGQIRFKSNIGG